MTLDAIPPILPPLTAKPAASPLDDPEVRKVAKEFEAVFLGQMVDEMFKTSKVDLFGGGHAEETWRSFLSNAVAESLAEQGGTGIAKQVAEAMAAYRTGGDA
ncbi:rod-binding protein [Litorisediminicola beolgyonensis]|uniref:Rod-binding protein n=1 Tax=Litorisediminicola beolgyonensis TaxID=1173614 RepID=A0ABW3ZG33_9RHOB